MSDILDQRSDTNGQFLHRVLGAVGADGSRLFPEPEFVKSASKEKLIGEANLAPGVYGNPVQRQFPCHTPGATWLSAVCFHGISGHVQQVKQASEVYLRGVSKDLIDNDYALVTSRTDGVKERNLPIRNAEEVKAASAYLQQYHDSFVYDDRLAIADKVLRKAAEFGVALENRETLEKQAGWGVCSAKTAAAFIFSRAKALKALGREVGYQAGLAKLALDCLKDPDGTCLPSKLTKIASFIDRVDRDLRLDRLTLPKPEECLFSITIKAAQAIEKENVSLTSGNIYSKAALASLPLSEIRSTMGSSFVDAVTDNGFHLNTEKLAVVARTLPRGDAELFDKLMAANRISPVYKEAAHQRKGLLATDLKELAAAHAADHR